MKISPKKTSNTTSASSPTVEQSHDTDMNEYSLIDKVPFTVTDPALNVIPNIWPLVLKRYVSICWLVIACTATQVLESTELSNTSEPTDLLTTRKVLLNS